MNTIRNQIEKGFYQEVFEQLDRDGYIFSYETFIKKFRKVSTEICYCFLMYAISKHETVDKHMTICELLMYEPPFVVDYDSLVAWHIRQALKLSPQNTSIKEWVITVYNQSPDCPFTNQELNLFAQAVVEKDPNNEVALEILSKMC